MRTEYSFPGDIKIILDKVDLAGMQRQGFAVDRVGFAGSESKTWVHLPPINYDQNDEIVSADIESGGDLHVRLFRGFLPPVIIEQDAFTNTNPDLMRHYLGRTGLVIVDL